MLDSTWYDKTVSGARIECPASGGKLNMTPEDVHQL